MPRRGRTIIEEAAAESGREFQERVRFGRSAVRRSAADSRPAPDPASHRYLIPQHRFLSAHHCLAALWARAWRRPELAGVSGIVRTADRYFTLWFREDRIGACDDIEQLAASLAEDRHGGGSHATILAARHLRLIAAGLAPKLIQRPHLNLSVLLSQKHRIPQGCFKERSNQEKKTSAPHCL